MLEKTSPPLPIPVIEAGTRTHPENIDTHDILPLLEQKGCLLLRSYDFDLPRFETLTHKFCNNFHTPATRQARRQAGGDNHTTEVYRDNYILFGHTEGTYRPYPPPPEMCFFLCVTPPSCAGGETTLTDGVTFFEQLPPNLRRRFEEVGIIYEMTWEEDRWQHEFGIETRGELETLLTSLPGIRYTLKDTVLHLFYTAKSVTKTRGGRDAFAVPLLAHLPHIAHPKYQNLPVYCKISNRVYFGDGETIPDSVINQLIDIHDSISYRHQWQKNDVLMIDNTRVLHGRTMTEQLCDRVLVSRFGWIKDSEIT